MQPIFNAKSRGFGPESFDLKQVQDMGRQAARKLSTAFEAPCWDELNLRSRISV